MRGALIEEEQPTVGVRAQAVTNTINKQKDRGLGLR
jgi:hypothetical protein